MRTILIQCTKTKRDGKAPAYLLYDESALFRKMWNYATLKGDRVYILSAKHGLVYPEQVLESYNEFGLSEQQAERIATRLPKTDVVELVAGKQYTDPLTPELEARGYDVIEPFRGMKIGDRMSELDTKINGLENETLC